MPEQETADKHRARGAPGRRSDVSHRRPNDLAATGLPHRAAKLFRIVVDDVDERDLRGEHAAVMHGLARALDAHGDHDRAAEAFTEAIDRYRALPEADAREELAGTLTNAAVCPSSRGDHTAALALITEAVSILRELGDDQDNRLALAEALNNLADTHCDIGNLPAAAAIADEAITLATTLHDEDRPGTTALTVCTLITRARAGGDIATLLRRALAVANLDHDPDRPSVGGEAVALATTLHEAGWPGAVLAVDMLIAHAETHPRTAKRALREAATIAAADDEDDDLRALVTAAAARLGIRMPTSR